MRKIPSLFSSPIWASVEERALEEEAVPDPIGHKGNLLRANQGSFGRFLARWNSEMRQGTSL